MSRLHLKFDHGCRSTWCWELELEHAFEQAHAAAQPHSDEDTAMDAPLRAPAWDDVWTVADCFVDEEFQSNELEGCFVEDGAAAAWPATALSSNLTNTQACSCSGEEVRCVRERKWCPALHRFGA